MALKVKHTFHTLKADGLDPGKVQASHWNADHDIVDSATGLPLGASGTLVPVGTIVDYAGITAPTGWLECAGQLLAGAAYPALYAALVKVSNVTITIATPAVISLAAHGLPIGSVVTFGVSAGGALPTGITAGQKYYVLSAGYAAGSFRIAPTYEGTAVNTTVVGTGTPYVVHAPFGAAGTDFNLPDLREVVTAGHSNMGGTISTRLTANYGTGEFFGTETVTLAIANMPSHSHGGITGFISADHTHSVSGSGIASGSTSAADLTHGHSISDPFGTLIEQSDSKFPGSGGNKVVQPSDAGGGTNQYYSAAAVNLNHAHTFSVGVSITGSTSGVSSNHTHTVSAEGSGVAVPNIQPTIFIRKIIYAGV